MLLNVYVMIKCEKMIYGMFLARIEDIENELKFLITKFSIKNPQEEPIRRWKDNIKMNPWGKDVLGKFFWGTR